MAGSRFLLIEFDPEVLYSAIETAVGQTVRGGYIPIIAHFERYECLYGRPERLRELKDRGAWLQLNFDRRRERDTLFRKNVWRRYVKEGLVDLLGSDSHGTHFRPLHVAEAFAWLDKHVDADLRERILYENFDRIVSGAR